MGANSSVAPNVATLQPEATSEASKQADQQAVGDPQLTSPAPANRIVADPVHRRHHRPPHAHHQAAHQPHQVRQNVHQNVHQSAHQSARHQPAYRRLPSIRRFLIYGRPHNRPDLPLVLIYPRAGSNYSRNTLAMFRAISESPNKPILGLNIIPFLGMNLISEVLGLDLTLIPERKDDLDQVEDDSLHYPSEMSREQLLRLMDQHGMMMSKYENEDEEDSGEIPRMNKARMMLTGQAVAGYRSPPSDRVNRGLLQLMDERGAVMMSKYNRGQADDEDMPEIQPRSLGILAKFHPRFDVKGEGEAEISEENRRRRSVDSDSSEEEQEETGFRGKRSAENSTTDSPNTNSTTMAEQAHNKTVTEILEQLLEEVIEFLSHPLEKSK